MPYQETELSIPCPFCPAKINSRCVTESGVRKFQSHTRRIQAWRAAPQVREDKELTS